MKKLVLAALLSACVSAAHADLVTHYLKLDTAKQDQPFETTITRGSTPLFRIQVMNNNAAVTNLSGYGIYLYYATNAMASSGVRVQGSATTNNTNGYAYIQFTSDQALGIYSNSSEYPATFWAQVVITNSTGKVYDWSQGRVRIRSGGAIEGASSVVLNGAESDPIFGSWLETGSVTTVESDPIFTNWLSSGDWDNQTNSTFNNTQTLEELSSNAITSVQCAGGWYNPDWFSLATNAYPYLILGAGTTQAVNSVYVSDVIVDSAAGYLLEPSVLRMSTFTGGVVFAAESNCTIQTVTVTNPVGMGEVVIKDAEAAIFDDDLPSGTVASVTATLNGFARTLELTYQPSNLYVYSRYQGDVAGTLRALVNTSLAARAANTNMSMDLYADGWPRYGTNGTWVRNTNCWAYGIDLTCASPYNTQGNQAEKGGTAITRQHIVFADHYQIIDGTSVLFVDSTNGCHWRRVEDSRKVLNTDCRIGILDEPLPASIHPAQVLRSSDDGRFLGAVGAAGAYGVRTVHFKAVSQGTPKVFAKWACYSTTPGPDTTAGLLGSTYAHIGYSVPGHPFSRIAQGGDSGQPVFLIVGTNTVLYSTFHSAGDGPNIGFLAPHIEQILREGFGYESVYTNLSYVDLSAWRNYNLPPTP